MTMANRKAIVLAESRSLATADPTQPFGRPIVVPKLVFDAGDRAARRFANFFGSIENDNTRAAYSRACALFFAWCDGRDLTLADIEPIHVGAYVKVLGENRHARRGLFWPRQALVGAAARTAALTRAKE